MNPITNPLFKLGEVVYTEGTAGKDLSCFFEAHKVGKWGDISRGERESNIHAIKTGEGRIVSRFYFDEENIIEITTGLPKKTSRSETVVEIYPISEVLARSWSPRFQRIERLFYGE